MKDKFEQIALLLTAILSILIALTDLLGLIESIPWLSNRIPTISLLLLGIVAAYLILERRSKLDKIDESSSELIQRMEALESRYTKISLLFDALGERDHFFEIVLLYGLRAYGRLFSERRIRVDREHALEFWLDCIRGCKRWLTVTYARPEESWDLKFGGEIALAVQQERIRSGGEIKRLFLVDDEKEYEHLRKVMKEQESIGVKVKYLIKSDLPKQKIVSDCIDALGTLDFALVDNVWVWKMNLDKARRPGSSEAIKNKNLAEKAQIAFNEIFGVGKLP